VPAISLTSGTPLELWIPNSGAHQQRSLVKVG